MEVVKLKGKVRTAFGKTENKKLVHEGFVPIMIYGAEKENISAAVNLRELNKAFKTDFGKNVIIEMSIDNAGKDVAETVISHIVEKDAIRDNIIHADFKRVDMSKPVAATIPIILEGTSPGAKAGGILIHKLKEVDIEAIPKNIPKEIVVNISELEAGEQVQIQEIKEKYNFDFKVGDLAVIVRVEAPKGPEEDDLGEEADDDAEAAEGATAEGGDAPAAEADA